MRPGAWITALALMLVPSAGHGQRVGFEARLFAGSSELADCVSPGGLNDECRLEPSTRIALGTARVVARDEAGVLREWTLAVRGMETAIQVRRVRDGSFEIARVTPAPPTLTVTVMPSAEASAPQLYVYNGTRATLRPDPDRGISLATLQRLRGDGGADDIEQRVTCATWMVSAMRSHLSVAPGEALWSHGTMPTGWHAPFDPTSLYRVEVCVGVQDGTWWDEGVDPLSLAAPTGGGHAVDVLCHTQVLTGDALRAAAATPLAPDRPDTTLHL